MKRFSNTAYYKLPILDGLELFDAKQYKQHFPFHTHSTYNITLVLDQQFSTRLTSRLLQAPAGTIVITNPGEVHATICENKIGSSFFTFYISPDVLSGITGKHPVFFDDKIIYNKPLFNQLLDISVRFTETGFDTAGALIPVLKELGSRYAGHIPSDENRNTLFQRFMEENSFEKFSLQNTAMKFGLDKYKFLRLFKYQTGLTPNNYIILKRIEKCKELLKTRQDLLDIAIQTGFYDATHLCKYFKKFTGITPLDYRNA